MSSLGHYRVRCTTEGAYSYGWSLETPTTCFNNSEHTIDSNDITIVNTVTSDIVRVDSEDGRQLVSSSCLPRWMYMFYTSRGDNIVTGTRGNGQPFKVITTAGDPSIITTEFRFVDVVNLVGGFVKSDTSNANDYVSMGLYAPATEIVVASPQSISNCVPYPYGAGYLIIPVPVGYGTHYVDYTSALNANVTGTDPVKITKAVPLPANNDDNSGTVGYWDWDRFTGEITPVYDGTGRYHLATFEMMLVKFVHNWIVWSQNGDSYTHEFQIVNKGNEALPHWIWSATVTRDPTYDIGTACVQKLNNVSDGTPLSGCVTVSYKGQVCTKLKYNDTTTTIKSKLEASQPLIEAGGVTVSATQNMNYNGTNIITLTFNTVGVRERLTVNNTLEDVTDGVYYSNVTIHTEGVDVEPDNTYIWGFYLGRKKTPELE